MKFIKNLTYVLSGLLIFNLSITPTFATTVEQPTEATVETPENYKSDDEILKENQERDEAEQNTESLSTGASSNWWETGQVPDSIKDYVTSYAIEDQSTTVLSIGEEKDMKTIQYIDENGIKWNVGASAQNSISPSDTTAGSMAVYGRNRYFSPMFKVLARVGIAAGLLPNEYGDSTGKQIKLQTGLPPKYLKADKNILIEALSGHHNFSVKFGSMPWQKFDFDLDDTGEIKDIQIMAQPMGTLFSLSTGKDMQLLPEAKHYFNSRVLIEDVGFNTFDTFPIIRALINENDSQTFDNLGMKQILKETADDIFNQFSFEVSVPAMQQYLETGEVVQKEGRKYSKVGFSDILEKNSKKVCDKATEKILEIYNPQIDYDYLVITGGTGAAWSNYIRNSEYFKDCDTVKIVPGNQGDPDLPYFLSNARGYFIYLYSCLAVK